MAASRRSKGRDAAVTRRLAWILVALALVLLASGAAMSLSSRTGVGNGTEALIWAITLVFAATGVMIASRHPANAIGWIFLAAAVAAALATLAGSYANYAVERTGGPGAIGKTAA